jgi:WD40 repeat protein
LNKPQSSIRYFGLIFALFAVFNLLLTACAEETAPATAVATPSATLVPTTPASATTSPPEANLTAIPAPMPTTTPAPTATPTPAPISAADLPPGVASASLAQVYATPGLPGHTRPVDAVAFSPDGKILATASSDQSIILWSAEDGKLIRTIKNAKDVKKLVFSPDSKLLAVNESGYNTGAVRVWSVENGQEVFKYPGRLDGGANIAFSPDGKTFVMHYLFFDVQSDSHSDRYRYSLWSVGNWQKLEEYDHDDTELYIFDTDIAASNGQLLATQIRGKELVVVNLSSKQKEAVFTLNAEVFPLAFDSAFNVFASREVYDERLIHVWSWKDRKEIQTIKLDVDVGMNLRMSPDGSLLAFPTEDGKIRVWSLATNTELLNVKVLFPSNRIYNDMYSFVFSPDSKKIAWSDDKNNLNIANVADGKKLLTIEAQNHAVEAIAFSPDSKLMATTKSDGKVSLTSVPDGKLVKTFTAHDKATTALAFSPDGKILLTGGTDGYIRFWSLPDIKRLENRLIKGAIGFRSLAFSPDGKYFSLIFSQPQYGPELQLWSFDPADFLFDTNLVERRYGTFDSGTLSANFSADSQNLIYTYWVNAHDDGYTIWPIKDLAKSDKDYENTKGASTKHTASYANFAPDGKFVAVAVTERFWGKEDPRSNGIDLWSTDKQTQILRSPDFGNTSVNWLTFSPDGRILTGRSSDSTLKIWETRSGKELFSTNPTQTHGLHTAALSPDGKYLASGHFDGSVKLWEVRR